MSVWYQGKTCLRIVGIIVEQYDSFKRKGVFMVQDAYAVQFYASSFTHTSIF